MKKIFKISIVLICIIIGLLIIIPGGVLIYLNSSHATHLIQNIVNKNIPGSLTWQHQRIKLLRGEFDFKGLAIKSPSGDKIASIERLYLNISTPLLFKKEIKIEAFYLEGPWIAMQIDTAGALNVTSAFVSDTVKEEQVKEPEKEKKEAEPFNFHIDSLWLGRAAVSFATGRGDFHISSIGIEINAKGDLAQKSALLDLKVQNARVTLDSSVIDLSDLVLTASLQNGKIEPLVFKVSSAGSQISLQSSVEDIFEKPRVSLDLSVKCALEEISSFFQLKPGLSGNAALRLTANGTPDNPDAGLRMDYSGGSLAGAEVNKIKLVLNVHDRYAGIDTLSITAASGTIALQGEADMRSVFEEGYFDSSINFDALSYKAGLNINHIELSQIPWLAGIISGIVTSHVVAEGSGILPEKLKGNTQLSLDVNNLFTKGMPSPLDAKFNTDASMHRCIVVLKQFELQSDFTQISGRGTYDLNRHYVDALLTIDTTDLSAILPLFGVDSARGFTSLEVDVSGPVKKNLKAKCHVRGYDLAYLPYPVGDIELTASLDSLGSVTLSQLSLNNKNSSLNIRGSADIFTTGSMNVRKNPHFDIVIENSQLFLQDFMDSLFGEISLGAHVHGTPSALYGNVSLSGSDFDLGVQKLHGITFNGILDSQRINIEPLEISVTPKEKVTVNGWVGLDNTYSISLASPGISLKSFDKVSGLEMVDGILGLDFSGTGTFDNPEASGSITISNIVVREKALDDINLDINLQNQLAELSGNLNFDIIGSYLLKEKDFHIAAIFNQTDLSPYFSLADQKDLNGTITGIIEASGNTDSLDLESIKANTNITDIVINHRDLEAISSNSIKISVLKKHIEIIPIHIKLLKEGNIDISGGGDLDGEVDFKLDANIPASLAGLFSVDLTDADGNINIRGALTGNIKDPDIKADITLNDISLTVPEIMQRLHKVNGHASVTPEKVTIDSINGNLDDGSFDCAGTVDLDSMKLSNFAIALNANSLPVNMPEMLDLLLNAKLNLHGCMDSSVIEGEIEMLEGVYYKDFNNISLISGIGQKKREVKPEKEEAEESFLNNLNFDVVIKAQENFKVDNNIARLEINPDLRLVGTVSNPVINGRARVVPGIGTITYLRNTFIVQKGVIDFLYPYKTDPIISIAGEVQRRQWKISLSISGHLDDLTFTLSTDPELEHEDIISLLMVGKTTYELSRGELMEGGSTEQLLAQLVDATMGKGIKKATGLDVFAIETGSEDETEEEEESDRIEVTVGKALSKRLMTKYSIESEKGELTQKAIIEYKLLENILLQTFNDDKGNYGGELQLRWEFR